MVTIVAALEQFLKEADTGDRRVASIASWTIGSLCAYLNEQAHETPQESDQGSVAGSATLNDRYCDVQGPDQIKPSDLRSFLTRFAVRLARKHEATQSMRSVRLHCPATVGFARACSEVLNQLADWLRTKGYMRVEDLNRFRSLVGDATECNEFADALFKYVRSRSVAYPSNLPDDHFRHDQFEITNVQCGAIHLRPMLGPGEEIVLAVSEVVSAAAREGWSISLELVRVGSEWMPLRVGDVFP